MAGSIIIVYVIMLALSIAYIVWFILAMNAVRRSTETLTNQMVQLSKQIAQIASFVRPMTPDVPPAQPDADR